MSRFLTKLFAAFALLFALAATPAAAQASRTWVSGVGDDLNPCSRTAPCKTFAGAISKTTAGGEINVLDSGAYGGVTITKSITIRAVGVEAGVLVSGTNGITVNAGANGRVALIGLDLEGLNQTTLSAGLSGVNVLSGFDVLIEDCRIHGFNTAGVTVNTTTTARVTIRSSTLQTNALAVNVISTGGTGQAKVVDSLVLDNTSGLSVTGAGNIIEILNNRVFGANAFIQTGGGIVRSYGLNLVPSAAVPTETVATK